MEVELMHFCFEKCCFAFEKGIEYQVVGLVVVCIQTDSAAKVLQGLSATTVAFTGDKTCFQW